MRAYFPNPPSEDAANELRVALSPHCSIHTAERPEDYEILIEGRPSEELVSVPSLKAIIVPFAGVPEVTLNLLRAKPRLTGYNLHHNASDTAEVAIALLFAAAKLVVPMDQRLRKNDWGSRDEESKAVALAGKTAVILGYGQIGERIARVLLGAGMHVKALRRNATASNDAGVDIYPASALHSHLSGAHVLIIALPLTSETNGLIGQRELDLMPAGSILVNIARGPIVDEEALYNALKGGHLHSAGLDVWYQYPKAAVNKIPGTFPPDPAQDTQPSRFPFGELENVVMSPHRGGSSKDAEPRRAQHLAKLILALADGQTPPNKIDVIAGY
jgi:phosphoglycerate dehydrogenase-like enzyme